MAGEFNVTQNGQDPSGPPMQDQPPQNTMGITQQGSPLFKPQITNNVSAGSGGGGGVNVGGLFASIGNFLGGLFAQGGMVGDRANGYAKGGKVAKGATTKSDLRAIEQEQAPNDPTMSMVETQRKGFADGGPNNIPDPKNQALATGYLVGALHQKHFGGTPDTLQKAAMMIKQMLSGGQQQPQGMADGGVSNTQGPQQSDQQLALQSLMQALGLDNSNTNNQQASVPESNNPNSNPSSNGMIMAPMQNTNQAASSMANIGLSDNLASGNPNAMRGYAMGGPGGPPQQAMQGDPKANQPPLQPGQTFQGDGSVKGPGTSSSDSIPAKLSNGEFVMSAPAVSFFGVDKLNKMNEQGKQGFMQAQQQVQANQPQGPQAGPPGAQPPGQPPAMPPPTQSQGVSAQMPAMAANGGMKKGGYAGMSATRSRTRGFMGL